MGNNRVTDDQLISAKGTKKTGKEMREIKQGEGDKYCHWKRREMKETPTLQKITIANTYNTSHNKEITY